MIIGLNSQVTDNQQFYGNTNPAELIATYGSPLYVYNEQIFRDRCRELKNLVTYKNFQVNYSVKANNNLALLKIAKQEGLKCDAMSPGEIYVEQLAGFESEDILYISNNVNIEEMQYAIDHNILTSIDSISQLEAFGQINRGGRVAIRFNPEVGAGHHEKVVTGGKKTKFGIALYHIEQVKQVLAKYDLKLVGINQHIGSLFMDPDKYIEGAMSIIDTAMHFENLEFVDLGGGFGIPYQKQAGEKRLDISALGAKLDKVLHLFAEQYGRAITFKIEPGRYISAESGVLLGTVNSTKESFGITYVGCDLGFNALKRPVMYDSHHDIELYRPSANYQTDDENQWQTVTVVGNICESGDIMAKDRKLPLAKTGDIIGILDAGAYGYSMASNYNNRLRPAEVMIAPSGHHRLIRKRDTFEDLVRNFI